MGVLQESTIIVSSWRYEAVTMYEG